MLARWKTASRPRDVLAAAGSIWVAGSRGGALTRLTVRGSS